MNFTVGSTIAGCVCACALLMLNGCHKVSAPAVEPDVPAEVSEGVSLKPDEIVKMGIATTEVTAIMHTPEITGFGTVIAHEAIAQALSDLTTAVAVERQSRSVFTRGQRLAGTPGAMPVDTQEAAERQLIVDQAALDLAKRRLSAAFGQNAPWRNQNTSGLLASLAGGESKLVRVTFSLGSPDGAAAGTNPPSLFLARINYLPGAKRWESKSVWSAPADASVPGRSFFALLRGADAAEGERLLAWIAAGNAESGVLVPAAAVVISGGKFWCYLETTPGVFVRTEIDTGTPTDQGYFVKVGVGANDKVVTSAAGLLLARETNPGKEAE
jgi:hypothetical protein